MRYLRPFCLAAALVAAAPVFAQTLPGDPYEGQVLARQVCTACHSVEKGEQGASLSGAPAFQDVADDAAVTALSLRVFFRTPHENMPDLVLSETETDDIIAYILSLK